MTSTPRPFKTGEDLIDQTSDPARLFLEGGRAKGGRDA